MRRRFRRNASYFPCKIDQLETDLKDGFFNSLPNFVAKKFKQDSQKYIVMYISYMVEEEQIYKYVIDNIQRSQKKWDTNTLINEISLKDGEKRTNIKDIGNDILQGSVAIYIDGEDSCVTYPVPKLIKRPPEKAETESLIFGPKIAFSESLTTNLNIVHWRMDNSNLKSEKFIIGNELPSEIRLIYLSDIAEPDIVKEMRRRLNKLETDDVLESSVLTQYIEDNSYSLFPQLHVTELPDRFCYELKEGKVGLLIDKSPSGVIAPTTFLSFFESTEDLYTRWNMGTFIRLMRLIGMFLSITLTPFYVAALTFHYEIIPTALLVSLGHSRSRVPFPPVLEALILEFFLELIREAGARLPTKVGQTMGIVGGIVVGQAIVQAGFTSNILIIIAALSALASFTIPSYLMSSAVRILRFPLIIMSGLWGFMGLFFCYAFLLIHLLKQQSMKRPYLTPIFPFRPRDLDNSIIRLPFLQSNFRAYSNSPKDTKRFKEPPKTNKTDIEE
ncbi:spore germination protein [Tenuibacillus multivorans]|uniref:GerA spore germination protein n=1 Tax=Tenuibacillus multivorans TaxID=237069 RepID=A0A1H0EVN5_9BACI|nr:spore germination protein [Tenuibacillus multivorans]GEL76939.1 spore germination protein [Tenuibacillus multivorans]SDN86366.1 GerA spore germination protein [Tenuibacillus multivorans]